MNDEFSKEIFCISCLMQKLYHTIETKIISKINKDEFRNNENYFSYYLSTPSIHSEMVIDEWSYNRSSKFIIFDHGESRSFTKLLFKHYNSIDYKMDDLSGYMCLLSILAIDNIATLSSKLTLICDSMEMALPDYYADENGEKIYRSKILSAKSLYYDTSTFGIVDLKNDAVFKDQYAKLIKPVASSRNLYDVFCVAIDFFIKILNDYEWHITFRPL